MMMTTTTVVMMTMVLVLVVVVVVMMMMAEKRGEGGADEEKQPQSCQSPQTWHRMLGTADSPLDPRPHCAQLTSFFLLNVALAVVDEARLSLVQELCRGLWAFHGNWCGFQFILLVSILLER